MKEVLLLKCGEIVLKGLNRKTFEDRLLKNLKRRMAHVADCEISMRQSVVYVEIPEEADADAVMECACRVFGFATISRAAVCPEKTLESVIATAKDYLAPNFAAAKTFKVETKRGDKKFPMTSTEISQHVGGELADLFPEVRPDMHHPDLVVNVEMREKYAFVHSGPVPGAGGMPIGSNGRAALLLSGGIDSPVAGWMMAKRGLELVGIHFFSYPYTSERAKEKVLELGRKLTAWCGRMSVMVVPFTKIQEEIRDKCHEELFTLIMRRFMMRIAEKVAVEYGWVRSRARPCRRWPSPARCASCRCSVPASAWTRRKSSASPARSTRSRPLSCRMRIAAPSLRPSTRTPSPRCRRFSRRRAIST